jgi:hypothetical protein
MDVEDVSTEQAVSRWCIELDWYQSNRRSFITLAQGCLCPECRKRLKVDEGEALQADVLATIKDCCSKTEAFITGELPILESIFRLLLANGNKPMDLEEMGNQLSERRGGDATRTSVEVLSRILESDRYYGLKQVEE